MGTKQYNLLKSAVQGPQASLHEKNTRLLSRCWATD